MKLVRNVQLVLFVALLIATSAGTALLATQNTGTPTAAAEPTWSLAAAGDAIMTRQVRCFENDSAFMALVKPIREADAAVINLEPEFAQTVNTEQNYHVYLTPNGDCKGLYISRKTPTSSRFRARRRPESWPASLRSRTSHSLRSRIATTSSRASGRSST